MSSKLEPMIWLRVLVTLAYMKGRTDVRTDVHDVMAIKPNFLTYFLNYGAPHARGPARSSAIKIIENYFYSILQFLSAHDKFPRKM